jgi:hypothetical protein
VGAELRGSQLTVILIDQNRFAPTRYREVVLTATHAILF